MTRRLLLVAGIPGTGKTTFCQCLHRNEGWIHLDIDWLGTSKPWPNEQLRQSWHEAISTNNPTNFVDACKRAGNVAIDWMFPVHCISI
jgi:broad-specificity NMP kinase